MQQLKLLVVFGTRPEAIKMAPLVKAFAKEPSVCQHVCVTGQHRQMLDQVLHFFHIRPDYDLNVMQTAQDLRGVTVSCLEGLTRVIQKTKPDRVLVHGDTSTTFAASLAAFYQKVPVAHIEAGLRSGNVYAPWPEEANRRLTSIVTDLHFAPTATARNNLIQEGVLQEQIFVTGNTVIDALQYTASIIEKDQTVQECFIKKFPNIRKLQGEGSKKLILVTGHRRENFGQGFMDMCSALKVLAKEPDIEIVYPVHLNPEVREMVFQELEQYSNIFLIDPLEYSAFVYLMMQADLILTDSGGIQEEAPSLGKPVLVMRESTERVEAVAAGTVKLVGTDTKMIIQETLKLLRHKEAYRSMSRAINPYGDGKACHRIVEGVINAHR